jgi:hypothetical protein
MVKNQCAIQGAPTPLRSKRESACGIATMTQLCAPFYLGQIAPIMLTDAYSHYWILGQSNLEPAFRS